MPPRTITPLAKALGHCLASDDTDLVAIAALKICDALNSESQNRTHAAARLGVPLRTLQRWLADHPDLSTLAKLARRR